VTEDWIHYFDAPSCHVTPSFEGENEDRLISQIVYLNEKTINWDTIDAAIIGVNDARNTIHKGCAETPDVTREYLYGLRTISNNLQIIDLGNIRGNTIDDRYRALEDITIELIKKGIVPIIIGGGQDYTIPMAGAIKKALSQYRLAVVDSKIDWLSPEKDFSSASYLGYLCNDNKKAPRDLSIIGIQKYLYSLNQENKIKEASFDMFRMGELRQQGFKNAEPFMRDADIVSVDMTAVRQCDQPARFMPMPNGLTGEEFCQLMWYAGQSDKLKAIGLFELDTNLDINNQGVVLTAQAIWHILEGIALRYNDYPVKELDSYRQFIVHLQDYELDMKFYNNPDNDRWWVEIPNETNEPEIVACARRDFDAASDLEIPERWFRFIKKKHL